MQFGCEGGEMQPAIDRGRRIPRNVLIIDDNEDLARSLSYLLELHGCRVEIALDGPEGVRLALQDRFDVVFIDIGLPTMSGYEVARAIRAQDAQAPMLLAQTAYNQPEDVRRSLEAGFDAHLVKPVQPEEILGYIAKGRAALAERPREFDDVPRPNGRSSPYVAPVSR
jgi:CheY-like chemotaxis protein